MKKRNSGRKMLPRGGSSEKPEEKVTVSLSISKDLLVLIDKRWRNLPGLNRSTYFEVLAQNDLRIGGSFTIQEKNKKAEAPEV